MIPRRDKGLLTSPRSKAEAAKGDDAARVNLRVFSRQLLAFSSPFFFVFAVALLRSCTLRVTRCCLTYAADCHYKDANTLDLASREQPSARNFSPHCESDVQRRTRDHFSPLFFRDEIKILRRVRAGFGRIFDIKGEKRRERCARCGSRS